VRKLQFLAMRGMGSGKRNSTEQDNAMMQQRRASYYITWPHALRNAVDRYLAKV
jgi:hypothetical protein